MLLSLRGPDELVEVTGGHPAVRGTLRFDPATFVGLRRGDAVLWWGDGPSPRALGRAVRQVGTFGPDDAVLALLADAAPRLPPRARVTLTRTAADALPPGWTQEQASDWDLRWLHRTPPLQPGEDAVGPDGDLATLTALLDRANPDAWARPGDPEVRGWWGLRTSDGLVALAADTTRAPGVGHVSSIGTDPAHRGRGHGAAVTAALLRSLVTEHGLATLGHYAANAAAARLYDRLGMATRAHRSGLLVVPGAS